MRPNRRLMTDELFEVLLLLNCNDEEHFLQTDANVDADMVAT